MKDISYRNKKGVSEIVSYVILVIIAISIGTLVFAYLSNLVPRERPECNDGLALSVESYICEYGSGDQSSLDLVLKNRGRFNIEAAYIRIGNIGNKTGYWINPIDFQFGNTLGPNDPALAKNYPFKTSEILKFGPGKYALEIQIASYDEDTKKYSACPNPYNMIIMCD